MRQCLRVLLPESNAVESDESVERFREVLRSKTVWAAADPDADHSAFDGFVPKLKALYPRVFQACELEMVDTYGISLLWKGENRSLDPIVLMAHYDVVEADPAGWSHAPFAAEIADGKIYARGAVDTKCIWAAFMEAAQTLMGEGFVPPRDIYFFSSKTEEDGGDTAPHMVEHLKEIGRVPYMVLDEGGALIDYPPLGVKGEFAVIGVAEKGIFDAYIETSAEGGHAQGARAHGGFGLRLVFGNLWLFKPVVLKIMKSGHETAAMVRTIYALTQLEGNKAHNVIPKTAKDTVNVRIDPDESVAIAFDYLRRVIRSVYPQAGIIPYVQSSCSDARRFVRVCPRTYRFAGILFRGDQRMRIHDQDENLDVESFKRGVGFYIQFIRHLEKLGK